MDRIPERHPVQSLHAGFGSTPRGWHGGVYVQGCILLLRTSFTAGDELPGPCQKNVHNRTTKLQAPPVNCVAISVDLTPATASLPVVAITTTVRLMWVHPTTFTLLKRDIFVSLMCRFTEGKFNSFIFYSSITIVGNR